MKKLLMVSPSLNMGGIEKALTVLANEFVKHDIQIYFMACLPGADRHQRDSRIKLITHNIRYQGGLKKGLFYFKVVRFIRKQANAINPDTVLCFGDVINPLVLLALRGSKYPLFISDRTSPLFKINPFAKVLKQWLYPHAAGFIAQTTRMADFQKRQFPRLKQAIIPNAIDLVDHQLDHQRTDSILYVGRFSWEKGVDRLIKAFAAIENKTWKLELVGYGPMENQLRQLAQTLQCEDRVIFRGLSQRPAEFYTRCSVFVLPSHIEGFPNALCEAMSAAMPVICFETIPYEDIFEDGSSGVVVRKDDVEHLTEKLNDLIADPMQRSHIGANARTAVQRFNSDHIAQQYLSFMDMV